MNRFFSYFNFLGILALVVLCGIQWRTNRRANLEAISLEKIRIQQAATIETQDKTIKGYVADLDDFRQRLSMAESELRDIQTKIIGLTAERKQLLTERDKLKTTLDQWVAAVAARDQALKQSGEQIQKLAVDRNDAVQRFNDLAGKYNALVKDWNEAQARH